MVIRDVQRAKNQPLYFWWQNNKIWMAWTAILAVLSIVVVLAIHLL